MRMKPVSDTEAESENLEESSAPRIHDEKDEADSMNILTLDRSISAIMGASFTRNG